LAPHRRSGSLKGRQGREPELGAPAATPGERCTTAASHAAPCAAVFNSIRRRAVVATSRLRLNLSTLRSLRARPDTRGCTGGRLPMRTALAHESGLDAGARTRRRCRATGVHQLPSPRTGHSIQPHTHQRLTWLALGDCDRHARHEARGMALPEVLGRVSRGWRDAASLEVGASPLANARGGGGRPGAPALARARHLLESRTAELRTALCKLRKSRTRPRAPGRHAARAREGEG